MKKMLAVFVAVFAFPFLAFAERGYYDGPGMMGYGYYGSMMGNGGWGLGLGIFGWVVEIAFWVFVVWAIMHVVKYMADHGVGKKTEEDSALKVLRERYAKGEIGKEEFETKKKDLEV